MVITSAILHKHRTDFIILIFSSFIRLIVLTLVSDNLFSNFLKFCTLHRVAQKKLGKCLNHLNKSSEIAIFVTLASASTSACIGYFG